MLIYRELMARADEDARVLDVGTKDGRHLSDVPGDIIAIDLHLSPSLASVEYLAGDGTQLPFSDGAFDFVVCNQVLEHVEAKDQLVTELYRVLGPKGLLLISFPNRLFLIDPHGFPPGFPLLPRKAALWVAQRLWRERYEYYRDHAFYLSAPRGRQLLARHFDHVEYATLDSIRRFPDVYQSSSAGRVLLSLRPVLRALDRLPGGTRLFETVFGYASYRCAVDRRNS